MPPATEMLAELVAASSPQLVAFAVGIFIGSLAPTYYSQERLRGFGRAMMAKLPYQPPPGMQPEEAMMAAVEDVDAEDAEEGDDADA